MVENVSKGLALWIYMLVVLCIFFNLQEDPHK